MFNHLVVQGNCCCCSVPENMSSSKVNDRQTIGVYFDLFCTNGFYPKMTLPTHFSSNNCTLIVKTYCKLSTVTRVCTAGKIMSNI